MRKTRNGACCLKEGGAVAPAPDRMLSPRCNPGQSNTKHLQLAETPSRGRRLRDGDNIFRLQTSIDLQYEKIEDASCTIPYREAVCALCVKTVSMALDVPLHNVHAIGRCHAEAALARQIAMYLCHTIFSLLLTEIGLYFHRDRTTVAYACSLVEDKRDEMSFDIMLEQLESLLVEARTAMSICVEHNANSNRDQKDPKDEPVRVSRQGRKALMAGRRS